MSQRLVRRLCSSCKESYEPGRELLDRLFEWDKKEKVVVYESKGCSSCRHTGYRGRIAIHEMVSISDDMRKLMIANAPLIELRTAAFEAGYRTMRYDGIKKVLRGLTTFDEVERVTFG